MITFLPELDPNPLYIDLPGNITTQPCLKDLRHICYGVLNCDFSLSDGMSHINSQALNIQMKIVSSYAKYFEKLAKRCFLPGGCIAYSEQIATKNGHSVMGLIE